MKNVRGSYILVRDPDRFFRPWSSFPEREVKAGLKLKSWPPGTVFWHNVHEQYYIVTEDYTLEAVDEWDAALRELGGAVEAEDARPLW